MVVLVQVTNCGRARVASRAILLWPLAILLWPLAILLWPLAILAVTALSLLVREQAPRTAAGLGSVFGLAFFLTLIRWLHVIGWDAIAILSLLQAAFYAPLAAALARCYRYRAWPVLQAGAWVPVEAARSRFPLGGFPWGRLGAAVRAGGLAAPDFVIWPENASDEDPYRKPQIAVRGGGRLLVVQTNNATYGHTGPARAATGDLPVAHDRARPRHGDRRHQRDQRRHRPGRHRAGADPGVHPGRDRARGSAARGPDDRHPGRGPAGARAVPAGPCHDRDQPLRRFRRREGAAPVTVAAL